MPLNFNMPLQSTHNSPLPVVILSHSGPDKGFPIVGYIEGIPGLREWNSEGFERTDVNDSLNLEQAPITGTVWINVYGPDSFTFHTTEFLATYAFQESEDTPLAMISVPFSMEIK